jgi:hypothetical protein
MPGQPGGGGKAALGRGIAAGASQVAGAIERKRLLQMRLDMREEDKREARSLAVGELRAKRLAMQEAAQIGALDEGTGKIIELMATPLPADQWKLLRAAAQQGYDARGIALTDFDKRWDALEAGLLSGGDMATMRAFNASRPQGMNVLYPTGEASPEAMGRVGLARATEEVLFAWSQATATAKLSESKHAEKLQAAQRDAAKLGVAEVKAVQNFGAFTDEPGSIAAHNMRMIEGALTLTRKAGPTFFGPSVTGPMATMAPPTTSIDRLEALFKQQGVPAQNLRLYTDVTMKEKAPAERDKIGGMILYLREIVGRNLDAAANGVILEPFRKVIQSPDGGEPIVLEYVASPGVVELSKKMTPWQKEGLKQLAWDTEVVAMLLETNPGWMAGQIAEIVGEHLGEVNARVREVFEAHKGVPPEGAVHSVLAEVLAEFHEQEDLVKDAMTDYFTKVAAAMEKQEAQEEKAESRPAQQPPLFPEGGQP